MTTSTQLTPTAIEVDSKPVAQPRSPELLPRQLDRPLTPIEARRVTLMERRVPQTLERARNAGVSINYLGVSALFNEPKFYEGPPGTNTDWIFTPADQSDTLVPKEQAVSLVTLRDAGVLPAGALIFAAHEVPKREGSGTALDIAPLTHREAKALVPEPPPPQASVELGQALDERSRQVFRALAKGAKVGVLAAAAVAAAPVVMVGAAAGALTRLDPIIVAAVPVMGANRVGAPAQYWLCARWDW